MASYVFLWTQEIVEHLAEHDMTPEEFERIVSFPEIRGVSRSSGRPCCWGHATDGRYYLCVYELLDEVTILPVTAYEVQ